MSRFIEELAAKVVVSKSVLALPARLKRARFQTERPGWESPKTPREKWNRGARKQTTPNPEASRATLE